MELPKRKRIRLEEYDYSAQGAYFVTVCSEGRRPIFWDHVGADIIRPDERLPLSEYGRIIDKAIQAISIHYPNVQVDKYCIMPNHIHLLISITADESGRTTSAPTLSVIVGQMKRWVSKQIGIPIWQKSFYESVIRNEKGYLEAWQYIEGNPYKWMEDELYIEM